MSHRPEEFYCTDRQTQGP